MQRFKKIKDFKDLFKYGSWRQHKKCQTSHSKLCKQILYKCNSRFVKFIFWVWQIVNLCNDESVGECISFMCCIYIKPCQESKGAMLPRSSFEWPLTSKPGLDLLFLDVFTSKQFAHFDRHFVCFWHWSCVQSTFQQKLIIFWPWRHLRPLRPFVPS